MAKKMILIIALVIAALIVQGCQTVEGFGEDLQWLGEKISGE